MSKPYYSDKGSNSAKKNASWERHAHNRWETNCQYYE